MTARGRLFVLFLLALPFAMFAWALPFTEATQRIGNDYAHYGPTTQLDLMWSVRSGTFPLYLPGFARGASTGAATLGQLYHPISWLSSVMPGYWRGLELEWLTFFRLLSLGVAHVALVALLRRLCLAPVAAFLASFPVVYNLRMLDSFRFGPSVDGYVAMLLACAASGFVFLDAPSRKPVAWLALSTYLLAVNGHPQWALFGLLAAGLFAVGMPWTARALHPSFSAPTTADLRRHVARLTLGFGAGLLVAAPYLLTFYVEYFANNRSRTGNGYAWTERWGDSVLGELDNFFFPFHADVHGAFAGCALFLLVALFPIARAVSRPPRVLWFFHGVAVTAFLFALGDATPLHHLFVTHLPFFGSVRTPGRLVLWIPVASLPILAWLLRRSSRRALAATGAAGLAVMAVGGLLHGRLIPAIETFSPRAIEPAIPASFDAIVFALIAATLVLVIVAATSKRRPGLLATAAAALTAASTWLCLFDGTWKEEKEPTATLDAITAQRAVSVNARAEPGEGMETSAVSDYVAHGLWPMRALGTVEHDVKHRGADAPVLDALKKKPGASVVYLDARVAPLSEDLAPELDASDRVHLAYNTSNRLVFDVTTARDGYFVFGLPYVPGFEGRLDGAPTPLARANVLFPAALLPKGHHAIELRFVSRPFFVGLALALATLVIGATLLVSRRRALVASLATIGALVTAGLVHRAAFLGPSFGTRYDWTPAGAVPPAEQRPQLAKLDLTSTSFKRGEPLPAAHVCTEEGHAGVSPALAWSAGPEGTAGYSILLTGPDTKTRWAMLVPATATSLPEGASPGGPLPEGSVELRNDEGLLGYTGPCPPRGLPQRFSIQVTALRSAVRVARLGPAFTRAIDEKTLARGSLLFTVER